MILMIKKVKKKIVELILQKEDSVAINRNTFDV